MDARLSLLTFPQRIANGTLSLSILLVPRLSALWNGDPRLPAIMGFPNPGDIAPAFADADIQLEARILSGLDRFPTSEPPDATAALPGASGVVPEARILFEELVAPDPGRFVLSAGPPRLAEPVRPQIFVKKYIPRSRREATIWTGPPVHEAVTDDSFHCAMKAERHPNPAFVVTPDEVSWGQIYAYCLRNHLLARRLGLIRDSSFAVPAGAFDEGGFLYVDLADESDYRVQANADFTFLRRYAARIPPLASGAERPLFAAALFPVLFDDPGIPGPPAAPGNYDTVFHEAAIFDDGFGQVVHTRQPVSQNLLAEDPDGFAPLVDMVSIGCDDEWTVIRQNRQLKEDPSVPLVPGVPQRLDAPTGVFAYRFDARPIGDPVWRSLVRVESRAPLVLGDVDLGLFEGEFGVEVHPMQIDGDQLNGQFWLPVYITHWSGASLVLPDEDAAALYKTEQDQNQAAALGRMYAPVGLNEIPLRYGTTYEIRARLMDPTGGGPAIDEAPVHEAPAPVATHPFRRRVVPESVRVAGVPTFPEAPLDTLFPGDSLEVARPLLTYPSVVFTGKYADPIPLLQAASDTLQGQEGFGIPDPDMQRLRIDVEVRALQLDNLLSINGQEPYALLYMTERVFPADFAASLTVPLEFVNAAVLNFGDPNDLGDLGVTVAEVDAQAAIVLPRAREVRLTLRAVADDNPAYWADGANVGKPVEVKVRRESEDETGLIADASPAASIRGIYLQPDPPQVFDGRLQSLLFQRRAEESPAMVQQLASELRLEHKGLTLVGRRGERTVFGASRRIRHTLAPDQSSLTLAATDELLNQWIVALTLQLDRDWTWDNLQKVGFEIFRELRFQSDVEVDDNGGRPIGDLEIDPTIAIQALDRAVRSYTRLVFLDAVEPKSSRPAPNDPAETRLPDVIELTYRVEARFRSPPDNANSPLTFDLSLPVTSPPAQVPRLASAGIALSAYRRDAAYASTEPRRRFLWLEFDAPLRDPNDAYFMRLLAYAPDPVLSDTRLETFVAPEEPELNIDPEPIRVISPAQSDDFAGLGAMARMEKASNSDRHFLVPLPPGISASAPELFGFFTYELCVGHAEIWSTAQGRFGRPLRVTGVQHPAPTLFCTVQGDTEELLVEAPFAWAVLNGKNVTADPPRTELWALLYAQVYQADGKDRRNILLDDRKLRRLPRVRARVEDPSGVFTFAFQNVDAPARGATRWEQAEIQAMLRGLGLPVDAPLSALCVEILPGLHNFVTGAEQSRAPESDETFVRGVLAERAGAGSVAAAAAVDGIRPLSDELGQFRILRTSPLVPAPQVCT